MSGAFADVCKDGEPRGIVEVLPGLFVVAPEAETWIGDLPLPPRAWEEFASEALDEQEG